MRNSSVLLTIAVILFLSSCKKDNGSSNSNNASQPKAYTEDVRSSVIGNSLITYDLSYDASGRLTAITALPAPPSINFVYTYLATNKVTLDLYEGGALNIHEIMWLNSSNYLDTTFQYNDSGDTTTEKYIYNANKQLIQSNVYDYSTSGTDLYNATNYTYDNFGNVISSSDNLGQTISYSYYSNLPNTLKIGETFLPQPTFFIKTEILNTSGSVTTSTHYYTFDSQNRIIKDSTYTPEIDLIAIKSYTY
jgi:hypothetical protein